MAEKTLYNLRNNAARLGQRLGENLAGKKSDPKLSVLSHTFTLTYLP
jgi:hypothetical protein